MSSHHLVWVNAAALRRPIGPAGRAFPEPVPPTWFPQLRERQRGCGVDMECIERGADCQGELLDAIADVRDSLRG